MGSKKKQKRNARRPRQPDKQDTVQVSPKGVKARGLGISLLASIFEYLTRMIPPSVGLVLMLVLAGRLFIPETERGILVRRVFLGEAGGGALSIIALQILFGALLVLGVIDLIREYSDRRKVVSRRDELRAKDTKHQEEHSVEVPVTNRPALQSEPKPVMIVEIERESSGENRGSTQQEQGLERPRDLRSS